MIKKLLINPQNTGAGCNQDAADSIACRSVCGKVRSVKLGVFVVYYLVNTCMRKKMGSVYKIFRKIWVSKKTIPPKMRQNQEKFDFHQIFHNKLYFFMSNLNSECSQLWFGIHIVHIEQKLAKVGFFTYEYFAINLGDFGAPLRAKYAT